MRTVLLLLLLTAPALALDCSRQETEGQARACSGQRLKDADSKLNAAYANLMKRFDARQQAMLRASEKAWLGYRDAQCRLVASGVEGGSAQPMVMADCLGELTQARLKELTFQLTCQEGDMTCLAPKN
ncbi:MAG TPA: lysozyme inhibitor LprI family protein [Rhizomicrobium sp.]|nr:lysozyme inhibitor LprI family protein [Rhizomicrobium sp.]